MVPITQAFVLAAGLGTRLRPLTDDLPKPLLPIFQKRLITFALDHLMDAGIQSFIINTHRLADAFDEVFPQYRYRDLQLRLVNEPVLLETGGGIKNVESFLADTTFITYSSDVLTDLPLRPLIDEHFRRGNDVTLALRRTKLGSAVALQENRVVDIANRYGIVGNYDFANIAIWSPSIFARIPPNHKVSFIPILTNWIADGGKVGGIVINEGNWFNLGSRAEYLDVHRAIRDGWRPAYVTDADWASPIHARAEIESTAQIRGCSAVGANCIVGGNVILDDTIVWPGSQIASGSRLVRCIVRSRGNVSGVYSDLDL
jgi:NDP-sugar pyrophosphorylase family protein